MRIGNAQSLPLQDRVADVVVSGLVLNVARDQKHAVGEMQRVVAPGCALDVPTGVADFDDYWSPFLRGVLPEPIASRCRRMIAIACADAW